MALELDPLRPDVALANRIVHAAGLVTGFGHISARIPDAPETFLFPTRASPALADANRLLVLDLDGNKRQGDGDPNTEQLRALASAGGRIDALRVFTPRRMPARQRAGRRQRLGVLRRAS